METSEIQKLRQRLVGVPEFCQSVLWPLVDKHVADHPVKSLLYGRTMMRDLGLLCAGALIKWLVPHPYGWLGMIPVLWGGLPVAKEWRARIREQIERSRAAAELNREIKQKAIRYLDPALDVRPLVSFPHDIYRKCGLFASGYDRATGGDHCLGTIGQTKFELLEIATFKNKNTRDSNGRQKTTYVPLFKGLLFMADFNKNFAGHTVVASDALESKLGVIGRAAQRFGQAFQAQNLVELENPEFEAQFKVTSTDPIECRYLLTPQFMESLLSIRRKLTTDVQVAFMDSNVFVAIPYERDFMLSALSHANLTEDVCTLLAEFVEVASIIDDLQLNQRIWNKSEIKLTRKVAA